jgi:hypothetical protein
MKREPMLPLDDDDLAVPIRARVVKRGRLNDDRAAVHRPRASSRSTARRPTASALARKR